MKWRDDSQPDFSPPCSPCSLTFPSSSSLVDVLLPEQERGYMFVLKPKVCGEGGYGKGSVHNAPHLVMVEKMKKESGEEEEEEGEKKKKGSSVVWGLNLKEWSWIKLGDVEGLSLIRECVGVGESSFALVGGEDEICLLELQIQISR